MKRVLGFAAASVLAVVGGGCGRDPAERAHLSTLQKEILTPSCALSSCHGGNNPVEGVDLREGNSYASLVNVDSHLQMGTRRVVPSNSKDSLVYQVITGTATDVQRMPPGKELAQEDIEAIKLWIDNGAKND